MRLLERIILVVALGTLLGSSGCARKAGPSYDPFLRFPATAQWAWDDAWNRFPDDPAIEELNIRTLARETITDGLAARGYTLAPEGGKVDFRVHYHVGLRKVIKKDSVEGYGSLSLTLVDASTNRNAWVGFIEADVDVSNSEAERRKRLQKEVNKMLKDFPPSQ